MAEQIAWPENEQGYTRIQRKDFSKYITEELSALIQMWHRISAYGWPQGKGYLAEPEAVREVVELFDKEKARYLTWEKKRNGRTN